ncbi:TetR family transcriptional regulator [Epibacterium sp. SM1979]|uniref:TetR family transcriptional regulator n=2 Tax=Tritonibacter litoralis TaxID=2662264 RepID=A0A843YM95_9RHOB|nr:TetR family transcriptional regulator [Tritonibacter litoralis]
MDMKAGGAVNRSKYDQIIRAAVAEFQDRGFAATSMDRICAEAEVSKRTLYKYFESKDNLFQSIVGLMADRFADALTQKFNPDRDIREQLTELAWAEGRLLISADVMAMARMVISQVLLSPELGALVQDRVDSHSVFFHMMRDADAAGHLVIDDPDRAANEFIALIKAKAFWPVILGGPMLTEDQMSDLVQHTVDMIMSRYAP